jgi:hypothetical protein
VVDILKRHRTKLDVVPVNFAERSDEEDVFHNLRAQLWFGLAEWLKEGGSLPPSVLGLDAELLEPRYKFDVRGRRQIESKDDIKKRNGGRSTDLADAACLAVYTRGAGLSHTAFAPAPSISPERVNAGFEDVRDALVTNSLRQSATQGAPASHYPGWMVGGGSPFDGF